MRLGKRSCHNSPLQQRPNHQTSYGSFRPAKRPKMHSVLSVQLVMNQCQVALFEIDQTSMLRTWRGRPKRICAPPAIWTLLEASTRRRAVTLMSEGMDIDSPQQMQIESPSQTLDEQREQIKGLEQSNRDLSDRLCSLEGSAQSEIEALNKQITELKEIVHK